MADQANISKSALQRHEKGAPMSMTTASSLDAALSAEGWIATSAARLIQPRWSPWIAERSARHHAHRWPAPYGGQVWVRLVPAPQHAVEEHVLNLSWGPWRQEVVVELPATGLALVTGKAPDEGQSATFEVQSDRPIFALFGLDDLDGEATRDIRLGWHR